jgi:hypothetical protein
VEGSCEYDNEPSASIKCWEFLEWLHNWRILKKASAPRVSEILTSISFRTELCTKQGESAFEQF